MNVSIVNFVKVERKAKRTADKVFGGDEEVIL